MANIAEVVPQRVPLTPQESTEIAAYLDSVEERFSHKLTAYDRVQFNATCELLNLTPILGQIHGVVRTEKATGKKLLVVIIGYLMYPERAEATGLVSGWKCWVEDSDKGKVGKIQIKRRDWDEPFEHSVLLSEYSQKNNMWSYKTETMLKKVTICQGFRLCFTKACGQLPYSPEELDLQEPATPGKPLFGQKAPDHPTTPKPSQPSTDSPPAKPDEQPAGGTTEESASDATGQVALFQYETKPSLGETNQKLRRESVGGTKPAQESEGGDDVLGVAGMLTTIINQEPVKSEGTKFEAFLKARKWLGAEETIMDLSEEHIRTVHDQFEQTIAVYRGWLNGSQGKKATE